MPVPFSLPRAGKRREGSDGLHRMWRLQQSRMRRSRVPEIQVSTVRLRAAFLHVPASDRLHLPSDIGTDVPEPRMPPEGQQAHEDRIQMTTDTHENDEQFVERMRVRGAWAPDSDISRLFDLALRGAAVRWRPINEAPKDGTWLLLADDRGDFCKAKWEEAFTTTYHRDGNPPHTTERDISFWADRYGDFCPLTPTHFIPLTALGEPDDK